MKAFSRPYPGWAIVLQAGHIEVFGNEGACGQQLPHLFLSNLTLIYSAVATLHTLSHLMISWASVQGGQCRPSKVLVVNNCPVAISIFVKPFFHTHLPADIIPLPQMISWASVQGVQCRPRCCCAVVRTPPAIAFVHQSFLSSGDLNF